VSLQIIIAKCLFNTKRTMLFCCKLKVIACNQVVWIIFQQRKLYFYLCVVTSICKGYRNVFACYNNNNLLKNKKHTIHILSLYLPQFIKWYETWYFFWIDKSYTLLPVARCSVAQVATHFTFAAIDPSQAQILFAPYKFIFHKSHTVGPSGFSKINL